jgi:hypothetical protein
VLDTGGIGLMIMRYGNRTSIDSTTALVMILYSMYNP